MRHSNPPVGATEATPPPSVPRRCPTPRVTADATERATRIERLGEELAASETTERADLGDLAALDARRRELAVAADGAETAVRTAREAVAEAERGLGQATTRLEGRIPRRAMSSLKEVIVSGSAIFGSAT